MDFLFISNKYRNDKNTSLMINLSSFYYLNLHFKLSSLFYSLQLVELFSYELPKKINNNTDNLFVYNFHSLINQQRFFIFLKSSLMCNNIYKQPSSLTELFLNANWLERELSELHGVFFVGKKDIRNLMLQYGDRSAPFQKSFPSIGTKEIFYDINNDLLIQLPIIHQY